MPLSSGQFVSFYEILSPLGAGAMGEVYLARDPRLEREVAIKVLPKHFADETERQQRFEREAKTLASLNHPGVAQIFGVDEEDGIWFLVLEFVPGETLEDRIVRGPLSNADAIDVCRQIAGALEAAHEAGVIHRDLKPANVCITPEGVVKLLDFGLAKHTLTYKEGSEGEDVLMTEAGRVLGTPSYMAPEQARGESLDRRVDIWSFGCVLYECLTGTRAHPADNMADLLSAIVSRDPDWSRLPEETQPSIAKLLSRCFDRDARNRLRDIGEARVALELIAKGRVDADIKDDAWVNRGSRQGEFVLRTEHIRRLDEPLPLMLGDSLTFLDNHHESDTLVFFLHGLGHDERTFAGVIDDVPCRGIAPSLYGYGPIARLRPELSIEDHNMLLDAFFLDCDRRLRPTRRVLVGFSAGADQALRFLASEKTTAAFDGVILLSPNPRVETTTISEVFAEFSTDPDQLLSCIKGIGGSLDSLPEWLRLHVFLAQSLEKFHTNMSTLRDYARRIIEPFEKNEEVFFEWYRAASERVAHLRFVYAVEESPDVNWILRRHLADGVLGDRYSEETIVIEPSGHLGLASTAVVRPHLESLLSIFGS
jgi:serine/threonine protein kinase